MQIKLAKVTAPTQRSHTEIIFVEKGVERFVKNENSTTLEIPAGKVEKLTPRTLRTLIRNVVLTAKKHKLLKVTISFDYKVFPKCHAYNETWFWSTIAENLLLADYEYLTYKSKKSSPTLTEVVLKGADGKFAKEGISHGQIVGTYTNISRDLANTPGGDMTPAILAEKTKGIFKGTKAVVTILDEKKMSKLNMGGVLGVGKGSKHKPKFIIIEYRGGKKSEKPVVFVGKGVTFDTGGLQIKPGMSMYEMHMDMSGGASVICSIGAIAKLALKKNVIGLIPAVENGVGEDALHPGDVLTMMSGATVDVLHTDAEGRLILADALHYAQKYEPKLIVDIATLTGASLVAIGQHANVIMTKDRNLEDRFRELGEESGDYTFPLPLWDEYKQYLKGVHADISNIPSSDSKYGGTITAGMFLAHFTKKMKWVHIDMAPRMTSVGSDKLAKGATGEPTRLLVQIAEMY
ncbi:MAG: leucyl aminopeptidase family protein [Candidatus Pacebacteria bacterium]|nr:leucyl aminopeptidase family protein [Candidatus Paceibacterota bacterium]MCF7857096.1 leucyl aminopeptidase family protein [Candidatus Paceibacterota bacterium]